MRIHKLWFGPTPTPMISTFDRGIYQLFDPPRSVFAIDMDPDCSGTHSGLHRKGAQVMEVFVQDRSSLREGEEIVLKKTDFENSLF